MFGAVLKARFVYGAATTFCSPVGIRSAQLDGASARVWAGVGVVAQSDPAAELVETQAKFRAVLGSLLS